MSIFDSHSNYITEIPSIGFPRQWDRNGRSSHAGNDIFLFSFYGGCNFFLFMEGVVFLIFCIINRHFMEGLNKDYKFAHLQIYFFLSSNQNISSLSRISEHVPHDFKQPFPCGELQNLYEVWSCFHICSQSSIWSLHP